MKRFKFADLSYDLVAAVAKLGIESYFDDYFRVASQTPRAVLMTASNPHWSFGGGIDAEFVRNFPYWCELKQSKGGVNERIGSICFTATVDSTLRATKEKVKEAIAFAISQTGDDETLILMGSGTGVGGLTIDEFISVLEDCVPRMASRPEGTKPK